MSTGYFLLMWKMLIDHVLWYMALKFSEWWYFRKYGTSFIEQVSLNHLSPWLGGGDPAINEPSSTPPSTNNSTPQPTVPECKVSRNPFNLSIGREHQRFYSITAKDPLTYYDMNPSAQDHQTYFTCEADVGKQEYEITSTAWRERNPAARIIAAKEALVINPEYVPAILLLAEEEAGRVAETERLLKREVPSPILSMLNLHKNLLEALLEMQAYVDVQALWTRYEDIQLKLQLKVLCVSEISMNSFYFNLCKDHIFL